jgi:subtilisin family serine protease
LSAALDPFARFLTQSEFLRMDVSEYVATEWDVPLPARAAAREGERLERRSGYFRYPAGTGRVKRLDRIYRMNAAGDARLQPPSDTPEPVCQMDAGGGELVLANAMAADYVIVQLKGELSSELHASALLGYRVHEFLGDGLVLLEVATCEPGSLEAALADLGGRSGDVEYAEPAYAIYPLSPSVTPDDPHFTNGDQWNLSRINAPTAAGGWGVRMGYNTPAEGAANVVAIMDSGLDLTHPDLAGNLWTNPGLTVTGFPGLVHGWDFLKVPNPGNAPQDDMGHGTEVAGVIGAIGNNGQGVTGVAQQIQLMPLRIMGKNELADTTVVTKALKFIDLLHTASAPNKIVKVVNHSWGAKGFDRSLFDQINKSFTLANTKPADASVKGTWTANSNLITLSGDVVQIAKIQTTMAVTAAGLPATAAVMVANNSGTGPYSIKITGVIPGAQSTAIFLTFSDAVIQRPVGLVHVAAAANFGQNEDDVPNYPACFPSRLIVAIGGSNQLDGPLATSDFGPQTLHLFAPAESIWTTTFPGGGYTPSSGGTSLAAAHVSAAVALFRMQYPATTEVDSLLKLRARVQTKPGLAGKCVTGGMLDLNTYLRSP